MPRRHFRLIVWLLLLILCPAALVLATGPGRAAAEAADLDVEMVTSDGEAQRYWARWRGPSGQGLVTDGPYPDRWSPTDNVLWKVPVKGEGNSSPIIWGDKIFLTTSYEGGVKRSLLCFSRRDGSLLWEAFAPDAPREHVHAKNGHASATPTTDGELIYAFFGNNGLAAFDMEGNRVWHRDLGPMRNYHGSAGSPLLYRDSLILYQDMGRRQPDGSFVAAFDKKTGQPRWKKPRQASTGWGTPVVIRAGEREELIVSSQRTVQAYDPSTGEELWNCGGSTFEVIPTPVVGHGMLFCLSGRAGPTLAIRPGGSGDVTETHLVWKSPKGSSFVPSPVLVGDYLYMVNDMMSIATCYDAATGKLMWQGRMGRSRKEGFSASPVAVNGKIFFTNDEGQTFVLKAGPTFNLLHVNELGERTLASPALVDGRWYFRTANHLLAIGD